MPSDYSEVESVCFQLSKHMMSDFINVLVCLVLVFFVLYNVPRSFRDVGAGKRAWATCGCHPQVLRKFMGDGGMLGSLT